MMQLSKYTGWSGNQTNHKPIVLYPAANYFRCEKYGHL